MMEWNNIKDTYPKSFDKFVTTMFPNVGIPCVTSLCFFDDKKLYKFFDTFGIYLNIEMFNKNQWFYTISLDNGFVIGNGQLSRQTREEIERDGFLECFKLMERRIGVVTNKHL